MVLYSSENSISKCLYMFCKEKRSDSPSTRSKNKKGFKEQKGNSTEAGAIKIEYLNHSNRIFDEILIFTAEITVRVAIFFNGFLHKIKGCIFVRKVG